MAYIQTGMTAAAQILPVCLGLLLIFPAWRINTMWLRLVKTIHWHFQTKKSLIVPQIKAPLCCSTIPCLKIGSVHKSKYCLLLKRIRINRQQEQIIFNSLITKPYFSVSNLICVCEMIYEINRTKKNNKIKIIVFTVKINTTK